MQIVRNFFLLCALALLSRPAIAEDPVSRAIDGAWLVWVANETRDRFMIVSGAKAQQGEITVESALFGYVDKKGRLLKSWRGQLSGDSILLSFVTPGDALVNVRFRMDETTVAGTFVPKTGRPKDVRMTRLPQEELAELRVAARLAKSAVPAPQKPRANSNSKIYLIYVGASDCPACRGYEAEYFGRKDLMTKVVPDFPNLNYVKADLVSYRSGARLGRVPAELNWLAEPDQSGKPRLRRRGVPFFALVVDDKIWAQGHGTVGLENLVAPEIKRAMAEKRN